MSAWNRNWWIWAPPLSVSRVMDIGLQFRGELHMLSAQQRSELKRLIRDFAKQTSPCIFGVDYKTELFDGAKVTLGWRIPPRGHPDVFNGIGWYVEKYAETLEEIDGILIPDPERPSDYFQAGGTVIGYANDNSFLRGLA